jgi:uncharacterized SAM-binding protein YcdF (DUF218 family)
VAQLLRIAVAVGPWDRDENIGDGFRQRSDDNRAMRRWLPSRGMRDTAARGLAMFLGVFTLVNVVGASRAAGFDANLWWIDLRFLPPAAPGPILAVAAVGLLCFSVGRWAGPMRIGLAIVTAALTAAVLANTLLFYRQWLHGRIRPGVPVPLSLALAGVLGCMCWRVLATPGPTGPRRRAGVLAALAASAIAFPLAQIYFFGKTDYRRHADAIVVFGARTYADGTPSMALADRTRTAVTLYRQGLAPALVFSGGPGDGATSEPQAMRAMALSMGVPASAITVDEGGRNTERTVDDTVPLFDQRHYRTVLAVSHFYHLPRVKLAYARALSAAGSPVEVLTVPAQSDQVLPQMPWYVAREVAALGAYYVRPLFRRG